MHSRRRPVGQKHSLDKPPTHHIAQLRSFPCAKGAADDGCMADVGRSRCTVRASWIVTGGGLGDAKGTGCLPVLLVRGATPSVRGRWWLLAGLGLTAQIGPRQDPPPMPLTTPISLAARERLREHQAATAKAVAAHTAALARLDAAVVRRNKAITQQDAFVAAAVLGLSKTEVSRASKGAG